MSELSRDSLTIFPFAFILETRLYTTWLLGNAKVVFPLSRKTVGRSETLSFLNVS